MSENLEIDKKYRRRLERNLKKYAWAQILIMRVYYPVLGVYLVSVGHLSLAQIAIITSVSGLMNLVLQMPAGYLADKKGNAWAMKFGSWLSLTSPLWYLIWPNFGGALIGLVLFTCGNTFIANGTIESLFHDTLVKLGRAREYAKQIGRAQSYGLIGNVIAVTLVPMTYPIHPALPFLIGFTAQIGLFILIRSFEYPVVARTHALKTPLKALRSVVNWQNLALFLFFGFVATLGWVTGAGEFMQLRLSELGVAAGLLGLFQACGSLMGAGLGLIIHWFERIRPRLFYLIDLLIMTGGLLAIGLAPNFVWAIAAITIFIGWIRVRRIVFQAQLLKELQHVYKATLISALSFFTNIWQLVTPALLAGLIGIKGGVIGAGYVMFAGVAFAIGLVLWGLIWLTVRRKITSG
jgi:hypothetical protein